MTKKRNHPEFPDRETLLKYVMGGLSNEERHRIDKLMLEHEFLREVVEGLEAVDPGEMEEDLEELSLAVRQRSGIGRNTGFNVYKLAATLSLIILASAILFFVMDRITQDPQNKELSMHEQTQKDGDGNRENTDKTPGEHEIKTGKKADEVALPSRPETLQENPEEMTQDESAVTSSVKNIPNTEEVEADHEPSKPDQKNMVDITGEKKGFADGTPERIETPDAEITLETDESFAYERRADANKRGIPEVVSSPVTDETIAMDQMKVEKYTGLSVPYMTAANLPHPVNGYETYMKYLTDSLRYPESALMEKIEGQVVVVFMVGADSIPSRISVVKPLGYGCDQEAIRLIREGPAWIPAVTGGKVVESEMKLPVRFTLPKNRNE